MVPDFALVNADDISVDLGTLLDRGPAIVTFILGSSSSNCRASLRALQNALPAIHARHGTLVAISPEPPDRSRAVVAEDGLSFDMLTDDDHQLGHLFGLTYQPPEPVALWLDLLGLVARPAGMPSDLILPATYVVDANGIAAYAFLDPDPRQRADPHQVLECLWRMPREPAARPSG
jgi:peroxiredoxin